MFLCTANLSRPFVKKPADTIVYYDCFNQGVDGEVLKTGRTLIVWLDVEIVYSKQKKDM